MRFLELAKLVATWSKDPSTKVGAIVVDDQRRVVGLGYNGFPRRVADTDARLDNRPVKYAYMVHAESNALMNAARTQGCTLYVTFPPCNECAKQIIQLGIRRVVYWLDRDDPRMKEWSVVGEFAKDMLREAGVQVCYEDGEGL